MPVDGSTGGQRVGDEEGKRRSISNSKMSRFACKTDLFVKVRTHRSELRVLQDKLLLTYRWVLCSEETASGSVPQWCCTG